MRNIRLGNTPGLSRAISYSSRGGGILFGAIFAALGTLVLVLVAHHAWKELQTRRWNQVPCTIIQSHVVQNLKVSSEHPYRALVRYRYTVANHPHMGATIELNSSTFSTYDDAQDVVNRYPKGKTTTCFVDPHDPSRAVLAHASFWPFALFLLLPLIFIAIGLVTIVASVRGRSLIGTSQMGALSRRRGPAPILAGGFFAIFLLVGIGVAFPALINPMTRFMAAKKWPSVPCTIVSSRVVTHHGSKGNTYSADVLYRYTFNGTIYHSSRYSPGDFSSSDLGAAKAIAARYRPRSTATCFVDPSNPQQAMLNRDWAWGNVMIGLIPIIFILIGAGGIFFSLRAAVRARLGSAQSAGSSSGLTPARASRVPIGLHNAGPLTLRPSAGPIKKLLLAIGIAVFWNGIVSIFLVQAVSGWSNGHGDLCLSVFMVPFVLMGLGLIGWVFYQFLALFNPRPTLTIDHGAIPLGGSAQVKWTFMGRYDRISRLLLTIEAREEATYRRGTTISTDRHVFHRTHLADVTRPMEIYSGKAQLAIPPVTMHTFSAPNNRIIWSLKIKGEIMGWPDVLEEFPIEVTP